MRGAIDLVARLALPPRCPGCGAVTQADHRFCATCWGSLRFLTPPWCEACNLPFEHDRGPGARCVDCSANPPRHSGVRGAVAYGPVARTLALRLKYAGRTAFAETAARLMVRQMPADADLIVPVPLHRWRMWSRGFNQAALISHALSRLTGVASDVGLIERYRATPLLRGLGARDRRRAVDGVFRIAPTHGGVRRCHVVLADDVYTSGATAEACTRVLLRAGAARVTILCWARVLSEAESDLGAD